MNHATLDPSDVLLVADLGFALLFAFYFSLGRPRIWYRDRLGWVILNYALAVVALLGLIVYAIVFEQKVNEVVRFAVALTLGGALIAKTLSVYQERREGRLAGVRPHVKERPNTMSIESHRAKHAAVVANASEIAPWYPIQRALRSIVGSFVVLVPLVNGVALAAVSYLDAQVDVEISPVVFVWLNATIAATSLVIGLASRLMAVPGVNAFLTHLGLGTAPKSSVVVDAAGGVHVEPDASIAR